MSENNKGVLDTITNVFGKLTGSTYKKSEHRPIYQNNNNNNNNNTSFAKQNNNKDYGTNYENVTDDLLDKRVFC